MVGNPGFGHVYLNELSLRGGYHWRWVISAGLVYLNGRASGHSRHPTDSLDS